MHIEDNVIHGMGKTTERNIIRRKLYRAHLKGAVSRLSGEMSWHRVHVDTRPMSHSRIPQAYASGCETVQSSHETEPSKRKHYASLRMSPWVKYLCSLQQYTTMRIYITCNGKKYHTFTLNKIETIFYRHKRQLLYSNHP